MCKYANRRQTVILYAGDFDPTGEDIVRNFKKQLTDRGVENWTLERVALIEAQVERYGLPEAVGKDEDPRADGFIETHGRLVQVEVEALDPDTLRGLFQDAIDQYWDNDAYEEILATEYTERAEMLSHCEDES